jgi:hypothetical protein
MRHLPVRANPFISVRIKKALCHESVLTLAKMQVRMKIAITPQRAPIIRLTILNFFIRKCVVNDIEAILPTVDIIEKSEVNSACIEVLFPSL